MGVNLVPSVSGFELWWEDFRKMGPGAPPGSTTDGSVEDGCVQEGQHRTLRFNLNCKNIGDQPLVIGNPADRNDIFEPSVTHGWIMKYDFNVYTLKGDKGTEFKGAKRPFCLVGGAPFRCPDNQGIAARGGLDRYTSELACQFIVIDGITDGEYTVEAITNATSVFAAKEKTGKVLFEEDNYDDNIITRRLKIDGEFVDVI
jgi:hypothetical protein